MWLLLVRKDAVSGSSEQVAHSRDGSDPPIINHQKALLPSSWRAFRTVNVQARVTGGSAVSWTVRNVGLVVCSKTLVAAYRGAYGLTLATRETGRRQRISTFEQTHAQTCAPCSFKATAACGPETFQTHDAAGSGDGTSLPILDQCWEPSKH